MIGMLFVIIITFISITIFLPRIDRNNGYGFIFYICLILIAGIIRVLR